MIQKDNKKLHGAVDKPLSQLWFCCVKNLMPTFKLRPLMVSEMSLNIAILNYNLYVLVYNKLYKLYIVW